MKKKYYAGTFLYRNEFHSPGYSNYLDLVVAFDSAKEREEWVDADYPWRGALYAQTARKHKIYTLEEYENEILRRRLGEEAYREQEEYERAFVTKDLEEWERLMEEEEQSA